MIHMTITKGSDTLKAFLHEKKIIAVIIALLTIACGVLFLIYGLHIAAIFCRVAGVILAVLGLYYVISFLLRKDGRPFGTWMEVLAGLVCIAIGVWMLVSPVSAIKYMQYVAAIIILLHGILDLQATFALLRVKASNWLFALILSIVTIGLGVWILLRPMSATTAIMTIMGIVLIIDGISDLFIIGGLSRAVRYMEMAEQEVNAIETDGTIDGQPIQSDTE